MEFEKEPLVRPEPGPRHCDCGDAYNHQAGREYGGRTRNRGRCGLHSAQFLLLALNVIILILNVTAFSTVARWVGTGKQSTVFSPARSALETGVQYIKTNEVHSDFVGPPRLELDLAWAELLNSTMIRLSEAEMREMDKPSIALQDGSGYVGYLEAHHQLHCIKRIYQSRYPEYYQDLTESDKLSLGHWEHCLETLRKGVMCHPDVTVNTYEWDPSQLGELRGNSNGPRECVNWDRLAAWADGRKVAINGNTLTPHGEPGGFGPVAP